LESRQPKYLLEQNSAGEFQVATPEAMPKKITIFAAFTSRSATSTADRSEDTKYLSMPVRPGVDPAHYWSGAWEEFPISSCDFCKIRLYKLNSFKNCKFQKKMICDLI